MQKTAFLLILGSWINLVCYLGMLEALEDSERLGLLRDATSNTDSGSSSSFSRVVDSTFNPNSDPAYQSVESQEIAQEQAALNQQIAAQETELYSTQTSPREGLQLKDKDATKIESGAENSSLIKDLKVDGTEKTYRKEVEDIFNPKKTAEGSAEESAEEISRKEEPSKILSSATLNQNPFYFGDNATDQNDFESQKSLLRARLMQQGMDSGTATDYVMTSSSKEELIIRLMNEEGYTYGEAKDTVG